MDLRAAREALRTAAPLVHCLTNTVVQTMTANALLAAGAAGTPWVLDPVAVGGLVYRTELAAELVGLRPTVVRGNASEVLALAGAGSGGRGVDSTDSTDDAAKAAAELAARTGGVVAVSGEVDLVTDGRRTVRVGGGSALLTRTTGAGCALGALVAAYVAATDDALAGTVAAHAHVAVAAERAARVAHGPGTFAPAWLDALDAVDGEALAAADVS